MTDHTTSQSTAPTDPGELDATGSSSELQADAPSDGVIRSEEELLIATELVETGRARLVKRVETETVTRTIELRREVLQIEQLDPRPTTTAETNRSTPAEAAETEPLSTIGSGPLVAGSFEAGVVEIVLMQEEALISTQMVPRERVRLTKRVISEDRAVDADLQVEHVDLEQYSAPAESGAPRDTGSHPPTR